MATDLLPPLRVLVTWREQGYSPEEMFRMARKLSKSATAKKREVICGHLERGHYARGMCQKCYGGWYRQQRKTQP